MASHEKEQASSNSRTKYEKFMDMHHERFLNCVKAEEISKRLQIAKIIPNQASKNSVEDLYLHMREQGDVESLRKLYSICSERDGYHQMKRFAKDMLQLLDKEELVDCDSGSETVEPPPKNPTEDKSTSPTAITSPSGKGSCSTKPEEEEKEESLKKKYGGEKPEPMGRILSVVEEIRNVVLLGISGSGKSTVGNRILGLGTKNRPPGFEVRAGCDPVTCTIDTLTIRREFNGRTLRISVTDTIGLSNRKMGKDVMTKVREHVQQHCRDGITTVLFVLSKKGRFQDAEQEVYDCIMKHCDTEDAKSMAALVLTGCDDMDDKQKADYRESFKTGKCTKKLVDFVKLGIHLVGFQDYSTCDESSLRRQLEEMHKDSIQADTDHLLQIVAENYKPKMVQEIMLTSWWEKCALF